MFVDSHCHLDRLDLSRYENGLEDAIARAHECGVSAMLCVCISAENRLKVLEIAESSSAIHASVGIHPCDVSTDVIDIPTLKQWAEHPKVVALGESGLDYFHSTEHVAEQKLSFQRHLQAGAELDLPVIVHTRNAQQDTLDMIQEFASRESAGVMHCFTETWEMAEQALELGFYISLSGIVTFKNALELKEVAKKVPLDRLLIETDSPYLAPVPYRGKPNEPKFVKDVAEYIAKLREISVEELAQATTKNYYTLFNKASLPV